MAMTFREVRAARCDCGDESHEIFVDYSDCGGDGVTLKQMSLEQDSEINWISLTPKQVDQLIGALLEYQSR